MRNSHSMKVICLTVLALLLSCGIGGAQEADDDAAADAAENEGLPEIPDEPKTVDPATFMSERLAEPITVDFTDSSLSEFADWIREEHEFPVLIDETSLIDNGILVSDPVSDRLDDDPLYLLLDRLRFIGLAWFVEDDILWITTPEVADERLSTKQYLVGDLFDAEYDSDSLIDVVTQETSGPWFDLDGIGGTIVLLGDVMFVRQTDRVQREVGGLLAALRDHARMTFVFDPPQHLELRDKLQQNVTADFDDVPLVVAVENLAEQAEADIRLDKNALEDEGVRDRQPVSLQLAGRPLSTVLSLLLSNVRLSYVVRDGVISITTRENVDDLQKTAIFDVRDLCRDSGESDALADAIQEQTRGPWFDLDGIGGTITFAKPGAMVIRQTERDLFEILDLLETYREALRLSKPRDGAGDYMEEFVTIYYRVESGIADDLTDYLPVVVRPETWRNDEEPEAAGTIMQLDSKPELRDVHGRAVVSGAARNDEDQHALVVEQSVLIIHQSRAAHDEIAEVIRRVREGDSMSSGGGFGGGGFGGGGFGGGFFSTE